MDDSTQVEHEPWWWDEAGFEYTFVENMRALRERNGMSQTEFAKRARERGLAFHQATVQRIETGQRPLRLLEAVAIADMFGTDPLTLMDRLSPRVAYDVLASDLGYDSISHVFEETGRIADRAHKLAARTQQSLDAYLRACASIEAAPHDGIVSHARRVIESAAALATSLAPVASDADSRLREILSEGERFPADWSPSSEGSSS